jgi:4-hydroxy-3-methylbut-2-en-1-yl diphosphate reductase
MKQFQIPAFYRSPFITKVKEMRKASDPRKKDFTPTRLDFGNFELLVARHFGFCYGVENAIERAYKAIEENPGKRIFLLSQMIHNPGVNEDLMANGIQFLQDTSGEQLVPWEQLSPEDVVIIPAFGTTLLIENRLNEIGLDIRKYDTTCPFVEKVWNRAEKLGSEKHTLIIHGKADHEETRATFSHSSAHGPTLIVKDLRETSFLKECIEGTKNDIEFFNYFKGKFSDGFDPKKDLKKIAVINQTTMLASETQEISDQLRNSIEKHTEKSMADTRDTLCYATNDNQSATLSLMEAKPELAIVVGGYNSSNTTHLVELLEQSCPTYFIKDESELMEGELNSFNIHTKQLETIKNWGQIVSNSSKIAITSGASCPDATVDRVIEKIFQILSPEKSLDEVLNNIMNQ